MIYVFYEGIATRLIHCMLHLASILEADANGSDETRWFGAERHLLIKKSKMISIIINISFISKIDVDGPKIKAQTCLIP